MEKIAGFVFMYSLFYVAENKFKDEAMFWLGKCFWPKINNIQLSNSGKNRLTYDGVKMLIMAEAYQLKRIHI